MTRFDAPEAQRVEYIGERDFRRVRDFLSNTFRHWQQPLNWLPAHWNFTRHFVVPMRRGIDAWEKSIGLWESADGSVVGVAHSEGEKGGDAWFEVHPLYAFLYGEMIEFAETNLAAQQNGGQHLTLYVNDTNVAFGEAARARGYVRNAERPRWLSECRIGKRPNPELPAGFGLRSMADDNDIERRRRVLSRTFGKIGSANWSASTLYDEMQRAPDYRPDLDLCVVAPQGEFASFCVAWYDDSNHVGMLEPVGTDPAFRRQGFGREVLQEGLRRLKSLGATRAYVTSNDPFYIEIGFEPRYRSLPWEKDFK